MVELHAHDRVAGLDHRHVGGVVGLRAGVRLDVGVLGAEDLLGAVDGELLGDVDLLAAAVVALAGVALGVLVGEHRAGGLEHGLGHEVLGGDHLQRRLLASQLAVEHRGDLGIDLGEGCGLVIVGQLGQVDLRSRRACFPQVDRRYGSHGRFAISRSTSGAETAPSRSSAQPPPLLELAEIDHGRRRAADLPPSIARSTASTMAGSMSRNRYGAGSPLRLAEV